MPIRGGIMLTLPAGRYLSDQTQTHTPMPSARSRRSLPSALLGLIVLIAIPAYADSPVALKAGATTPQTEFDSPGMSLGGSLSGPRWRPFSGLLVVPQLELFLARRHTGVVANAGDNAYTVDFLELPLLVRTELTLGGRSFYAMAGGYGSLVLRADETTPQGRVSPANMAGRYDFGLLAAGGLSLASSPWGELFIELRYQRGQQSLLPTSEQKHQAFSLLLGYGLGTNAASSTGGEHRRLTLKGGLVATRFQVPGVATSPYVPGFAFGGAFSPVRVGSWIALTPQVELAFVHRGEHHGLKPAGSLTLDDVEASAQVRGEVVVRDKALYGLAGLYGSLLVRAQQNLDGEILAMRDAVRPFDAGWLAGVGAEFATFGDATLLLEVRLQRSLMSRFSESSDVAIQAFIPAIQESLFLVFGVKYGAPNAAPQRIFENEPDLLYSANDQGDGESSQRSGRTVSIRMARLSDRWLQDLQFRQIEPSHRDGAYGYQITYIIPGWKDKDDKEKHILFWDRSAIDFDDSDPKHYADVRVPLKDGRLVRPTRITSESLPDVHRWILVIENDLQKQADGAIQAMEGFLVVAELGVGRYSLRRTTVRKTSNARSVVSRRAARRRVIAKARAGNGTQASGVWKQPPISRGNAIETLLGRNVPANFPVIDRFKNGIATSIKSLDLDAKSYQSAKRLTSRVRAYINKIAHFRGDRVGRFRIESSEVHGRVLELAVPHSGTPAQQQALQQLAKYARSVGVDLKVIIFP
ncbi:MAG: hypothetical protein Tsb0020_09410 [Haliangiales bacterium]